LAGVLPNRSLFSVMFFNTLPSKTFFSGLFSQHF